MKYFVIFSLTLAFALGAFAEEVYLKDVPEGHWATDAVYELVKMGVTSGYPDGTFRGEEYIDRYEIAAFLSKSAGSLNLRDGKNEKLIEELKTELALIKYGREKAAGETGFSGTVYSRSGVALIIPRGGVIDCRLKTKLVKKFGYGARLKINLDTMDAGFGNPSQRSLSELLDIEANFKLSPFKISLTAGPGPITHRDPTGIIPAEDRMIYERPYTAIKAIQRIKNLEISTAYAARKAEASGRIEIHELSGQLKYLFSKYFNLAVQPRYLFEIDGRRDLRGEINLDMKLLPESRTRLFLGIGSVNDGTSGLHLRAIQDFRDLFGAGVELSLRADKIGGKYRLSLSEDAIYFLNNFNRTILDGTVDLGWSLAKKINKWFMIEEKGNLSFTGSYKYGQDYPGTHYLEEVAIKYFPQPKVALRAFYRFYKVPSGINQYGEAVPVRSDLLGVGVKCSF